MNRTTWKNQRFYRDKKFIVLDNNENCDALLESYMAQFIKSLNPSALIKYPNLGKAYLALNKFGIDPNTALLTSGAEGALRSIVERYCKEMSSIAMPIPTFKGMEVIADIYKLKMLISLYDKEFNFEFQSADMVYIANPDNCTGTIISLDRIEDLCKKYKIVIVDEAYYGFGCPTALSLLTKYNNLFIVRSFSKSMAAAGMRIGMVISTKDNIADLIDYKPGWEISSIACEYLDFIEIGAMEESISRVLMGKCMIEEELTRLGYEVKKTYANFILVKYDLKLWENLSKFAIVKDQPIAGNRYIRMTAVDHKTARTLIDAKVF